MLSFRFLGTNVAHLHKRRWRLSSRLPHCNPRAGAMHSDCAAGHSQVWTASWRVCRQKSPRPAQRAKHNTTPKRKRPPRNNAYWPKRKSPGNVRPDGESGLSASTIGHAHRALSKSSGHPRLTPTRCESLPRNRLGTCPRYCTGTRSMRLCWSHYPPA